MHITTMLFDHQHHEMFIEADTTAAFIGEMRGFVSQRFSSDPKVALLELNIATHSYFPEFVQQWVVVRADENELLKDMEPFQVLVQAKPDGTIKLTHLRDMVGRLGWHELLDERPS